MEPLRPDDPEWIGRYRLVARLGAGGMGVVYLGRTPAGLPVAVKVVSARYADDVEFRTRFRREIAAARAVSGAYTASVLDADPDAIRPWLAAAYLPGLSLREAISAHGRFPPATVRTLAAGLAEALVDIHRVGLTHRDLKPGNIMLTTDGLRVIDFGIARPEGSATITRVGMNPGTPGFMSPEQAAGGRVGPSSDVFSFGAVLAFAATAKEPFRSGGVETVLQQVRATHTDQWLGDLIEACLRREQDRRPSASDLLTRLDGASLAQGARWLPADLTVAVAHRAAQAQHVLDDRTARPWSEPPMLDQSRMAEETLDPAGTSGDPPPRRVSRRGLVFGGAAVLLAAGLTTEAVVLARNRNPGLPPAKASTSPSPSLPPSPTPAPVAVSRWKAKVSDYYPDLLTAGGLVLAHAPGVLRALDPKTGKTRWIHHSWDSNHVGVAGDTLFLYDHFQGSGLLVAVQAASGADRWKYDPPPNWVPSYPVAGASLACFGSTTSITALNLSDGRRRWTAPVNSEFGIAVGGDAVVGVSRTTVSGLDAASGRTRWTYPADFGHNPEITQGLVVVADGPGTVHALRADNGQLVWKRDLGSTVYGCFGFGETGGLLYFGTADGKAHALRTTTGEVTWERQLTAGGPRNQWNALGFSGGMLYVGGADRTVYALDGADGRTKWTYPADVTVRTSAPVAVAGLVFIGTGDGSVVALSPPAGGQRAGA